MARTTLPIAWTILALQLVAGAPRGQELSDLVMLVPGVKGDSTVVEKGIPVEAWSYGLAVPQPGVVSRFLTAQPHLDPSLPKLIESCLKGTTFKTIRLVGLEAGARDPTLSAAFFDARFTSMLLSHHDGGEVAFQAEIEFEEEVFDVDLGEPGEAAGTPGGAVQGGGPTGFAFLKLPHVKGSASETGVEGMTPLTVFTTGVQNPAGSPFLLDVLVGFDAEPHLDENIVKALEGKLLNEASILVRGSDQKTIFEVVMTKVRLVGASVDAQAGDTFHQSLTLRPEGLIQWKYQSYKKDGTQGPEFKVAFDVQSNKVSH